MSEPLIHGSVPCRKGHRDMISSHWEVIWGSLGMLQRHEDAKNHKRFNQLAAKSISQGICILAIDPGFSPKQVKAWGYNT